jgi:signal transduction histidine kinase
MIASLKNRGSVVLSELKPHDLVDEIIDELRFAADAGGIRFENLIPEDCIALSDPARLRIIFSNLISNAIRYHDPEKTEKHILIRCDKAALSVSFSVEDNGLGIADEHQANIFETYYTIGNVAGSSGLGLSNVRDAVQKLRGKIELKSKLGEGSAFTIILPLN